MIPPEDMVLCEIYMITEYEVDKLHLLKISFRVVGSRFVLDRLYPKSLIKQRVSHNFYWHSVIIIDRMDFEICVSKSFCYLNLY